MSERAASIFVVDDDAAVRDSLELLLGQDGFVVETYGSAEAFLAACRPEAGGCAIVDLHLPGMDGIRLQQEMSRLGMLLPIVFLTGNGDIPTSVRAIKAGAVDFLTKPITRAALVSSVRAALEESDRRHTHAKENHSAASRLAGLTERELEVTRLAVEGLPNKEIARRLDISHRTVEIHKAHIMQKTGAASLLELARIAEAAGLRS